MAFLVNASRADFGGDLNLEFKDLPPGVTVETLPMLANRSDVPVLLTAAADAPLAGALVDVVGRHADPNQKIEGHLRQRTSLVRGQNNIEVWNQYAERLATAVTKKSPFKIEIVEPKVPLVRDGAMNLKVVATRDEGFNAPIAVQMLYNPPGVGSSGSIVIPEGQTEAIIPLTANGGRGSEQVEDRRAGRCDGGRRADHGGFANGHAGSLANRSWHSTFKRRRPSRGRRPKS